MKYLIQYVNYTMVQYMFNDNCEILKKISQNSIKILNFIKN